MVLTDQRDPSRAIGERSEGKQRCRRRSVAGSPHRDGLDFGLFQRFGRFAFVGEKTFHIQMGRTTRHFGNEFQGCLSKIEGPECGDDPQVLGQAIEEPLEDLIDGRMFAGGPPGFEQDRL